MHANLRALIALYYVMNSDNYVTRQTDEVVVPVRRSRGRPKKDPLQTAIRAKFWVHHLMAETGIRRPNRLGDEFLVGDSKLFGKYARGQVEPLQWVKAAERMVPGSATMLTSGPSGLTAAMFGSVEDCWPLAIKLDTYGSEWIGPAVPFDVCVERASHMVARQLEQGADFSFSEFVRIAALMRLRAHLAAHVRLPTDGLYELAMEVLRRSPEARIQLIVARVLNEFLDWSWNQQSPRVMSDPDFVASFTSAASVEVGDRPAGLRVWSYQMAPLAFIREAGPSLRRRHCYLDDMPTVADSLGHLAFARPLTRLG